MKKMYVFAMLIIAFAGYGYKASAQADLAGVADVYEVIEQYGGYTINGNIRNVGSAPYNGPVSIYLAFYTLSDVYIAKSVASISNSEIAPGSEVGFGVFVHKDSYPWSSYLTVNTKYHVKIGVNTNVDGNPSNDDAFLADGQNKYEFNYYVTGGVTDIEETTTKKTIGNIYPNPVSNNATIEFSLSYDSPVCLKIYNAMGTLVQVVENKEMTSGTYSYIINTETLTKGLYFYVLETNSERIMAPFARQ